MSELTICNFCKLQSYKRRAKEQNKEVQLIHAKDGGIDVYLVPKGEKADTRQDPKTGNNLSDQWKSWFMELSKRCVC